MNPLQGDRASLTEVTLTICKNAQQGAVTIGNFDGVHRGHQSIVQQVRKLADQVSGPAVVFTFDPPPARLLRPESAPASLMQIDRRTELLKKMGIDQVIVYPTTKELLDLGPELFFERIIVRSLKAKAIAEGENFRFGKDRRGDVSMLKRLCDEHDMLFSSLALQENDGGWISSTRIRALIETGDIAAANQFLVEPYRIAGKIVQGAQRGRTLGFPTANLESISVLCPPPGVYAGRVAGLALAPEAIGLPVAIHIGPNPTFGESHLKLEAHIIGFNRDIYGDTLALELLAKLRDVNRFESKEQLLAQLRFDVEQTKQIEISSRAAS